MTSLPARVGLMLVTTLLATASAAQDRPATTLTIRAARLTAPLEIDGRLDEAGYREHLPASGFVQQTPDEGAPATERTEAWVFFDQTILYVSARCWDSASPREWVANEMRRDAGQLSQNDSFGVLLDTFHDGRDGVLFSTNPLGALADQQITEERIANADWDPVWSVRTGRFDGGWTVEMAVPFKSLRYRPGREQVWGIQLRRTVRRRNEWSFLSPVPIAAAGRDGSQGILRVSAAATLVGLEVPPGSRNLELKPYAISRLTTDRAATPRRENDADGDVGVDVKYGLTQNLTADVTYNTDFAQVEADQAQVNLTRFNIRFPEKREFFLEGSGLFDFGRSGGLVPNVFFSRRIGLADGDPVPIVAGGRLTGKVGPYSIGALNIETDRARDVAATNFTVARIKRNVLRRSTVGAIYTGRSTSVDRPGANRVFGVDAKLAFRENVNANAYIARSSSPGLTGGETSYHAQFDYPADRYGLRIEQLNVGRHFNPEVGFVRRSNIARTFAEGRFSPRPSMRHVRQFTVESSVDYTRSADTGRLETREQVVSFETEFADSSRVELDVIDSYERLDDAFDIEDGVTIPAGSYDFRQVELVYTFARQRPVNGSLLVRRGSFYGGTLTVAEVNASRIEATTRLSIEPSLSVNQVDLPFGSFVTRVVRAAVAYTFTPRMFVAGLLQHSSAAARFGANVRLRWEYRPGSELFVVYGEDRDTRGSALAQPRGRSLAIKINRLFRY